MSPWKEQSLRLLDEILQISFGILFEHDVHILFDELCLAGNSHAKKIKPKRLD